MNYQISSQLGEKSLKKSPSFSKQSVSSDSAVVPTSEKETSPNDKGLLDNISKVPVLTCTPNSAFNGTVLGPSFSFNAKNEKDPLMRKVQSMNTINSKQNPLLLNGEHNMNVESMSTLPQTADNNTKKNTAGGYMSDGLVQTTTRERKKGVAWTEDEHKLFLVGLRKLGKGDWRGISRHYVRSRTPTQVASHAQKYFIRQNNMSKRKRRTSLFDISPDVKMPDIQYVPNVPFKASDKVGAVRQNVHKGQTMQNRKQQSKEGMLTVNHMDKKGSKNSNSKKASKGQPKTNDPPQIPVPSTNMTSLPVPFLSNNFSNPFAAGLPHPLAFASAQQSMKDGEGQMFPFLMGMPHINALLPFLAQYPAILNSQTMQPGLGAFQSFNGLNNNTAIPTSPSNFTDLREKNGGSLCRPTPTYISERGKTSPFVFSPTG